MRDWHHMMEEKRLKKKIKLKKIKKKQASRESQEPRFIYVL